MGYPAAMNPSPDNASIRFLSCNTNTTHLARHVVSCSQISMVVMSTKSLEMDVFELQLARDFSSAIGEDMNVRLGSRKLSRK